MTHTTTVSAPRRRNWMRRAGIVLAAVAMAACAPGPSATAPSTSTTTMPGVIDTSPLFGGQPPTSQPATGEEGDGGSPDGSDAAPVTVPAGVSTPAEVVSALEAQRTSRPFALYWRHLLLHGTASDAYAYINDPSKTDLDGPTRARVVDQAIAALELTETWHSGQPRPQLPDFDSVARELTTRKQVASSIDVLAANAARSTDDAELIDALIVYRPVYADGSSDRTNRLVIVMTPPSSIVNAYFF